MSTCIVNVKSITESEVKLKACQIEYNFMTHDAQIMVINAYN